VPSRRLQWRCGSGEQKMAGVPVSSQPLAGVSVQSYVDARNAPSHFLLWIPIPLTLLRYSVPCTILLPLHCPKYCTYSTTNYQTHATYHHHLSGQHNYPTLTSVHSNVPRHAIVQRIQVLPRVCRFARHTKLQTKRPRLISYWLLSVTAAARTTISHHHRTSYGASTAHHPEPRRIRYSHLGRQAADRASRPSSDNPHQREPCALATATTTTEWHRANSHSLPRP
jgi:hypothetical protein